MRRDLIKASELHFKAHIEKHRINIEILLEKAVGVAEHSDIMETIEKELALIAEYDDKLNVLKKYFPLKNSSKRVLNGYEKNSTTFRWFKNA